MHRGHIPLDIALLPIGVRSLDFLSAKRPSNHSRTYVSCEFHLHVSQLLRSFLLTTDIVIPLFLGNVCHIEYFRQLAGFGIWAIVADIGETRCMLAYWCRDEIGT